MSGIVSQNVGRPSGLIKAVSGGGGGGGTWVEIKTLTSDGSDGDLSFVDGASDVVIDSTYPIYCFQFINIHPETNGAIFQHNLSSDTGSSYAVTKTTTYAFAYQHEYESPAFGYNGSYDLAQSTSPVPLAHNVGSQSDGSLSGYMYLFNPSSTTFIKQFFSRCELMFGGTGTAARIVGGYGNTASAVDAVQFNYSTGEIQGGNIKLFGIKDS